MTTVEPKNQSLWKHYELALEEFKLSRDKKEVLNRFREIRDGEDPPVELLLEIAKKFQKFQHNDDAKKAFGRILQIDNNHRETWKRLSSLYFKLKDIRKAEFCLQKFYTLAGGNAQLNKATEIRLASSGKLKKISSNQVLGLQDGLTIQKTAPRSVMSLSDFEEHFKTTKEDLPSTIKRIVQFAQHQIVDYRLFERQPGNIGTSIDVLQDPGLINYLKSKGITHFFKFQEEAFAAIQKNQDICIVAPTGNGKTEAFLLPSLLKIRDFKDFEPGWKWKN
jgi:tetratricopeptide (TPR) repeat protein